MSAFKNGLEGFNMRNFIKNALVNTRNKNMKTFGYHYECDNKDIISVKGNVENEVANFKITRTKGNGHRCSSVPVQGMPLTDTCINQIVEIAVEAL